MSDGFICFLPRSVQRSLWFPISRSSPFSHILPAALSSCVEKGEANAWSRLQVASFFSSQIPERQWQKRSSSSAGPPVTGNTCRTSWISNYVHSFHCYSLIVAKPDFWGNLSKSYRKSIYQPFSNHRSNDQYRFNTYLDYR